MTNKLPEADQTTAQAESTLRRTRPARRSAGRKYHVQFLPEGADSEPEFKIELPGHVDPENFIDRQEDFEAGRYRIALRDDGKFTRESWTYRKDDLPEPIINSEDDGLDEELFVSERVESPTFPEDFDRRVAEIAARAVIEALEAKERARATQPTPQPLDPFALVERSLEVEEKIRARAVRNNPPREEAKDSTENFLKMFDTMTTIAERIAPIREHDKENSGFFSGVGSLIREVAPHAKTLLPLIPGLRQAAQGQAPQTNGNGAVHPASNTPQDAARVDPVNLTLTIIVDDLKKNKRTGHAADAIDDLFAKMPDLKPQLQPFFAAPANELLLQLSQIANEDLSAYSHAGAWIEDLQAEFSDASEGEETENEAIVRQKATTA